MIATVLFIIGFIIIYLTRPKKQPVPFEDLRLEGYISNKNKEKFDEESGLESESNHGVQTSLVEQIEQQKENLSQVDPILQIEKPYNYAIQYLNPIPSLQYAGLLKDENTSNNLLQYKEKDLEPTILANSVITDDLNEIYQNTSPIDKVELQENHIVDVPESTNETFLPRIVVIEEPTQPNENPDPTHDKTLVSDVDSLFNSKLESATVEPNTTTYIDPKDNVEIEDDSIIDIGNQPLLINHAEPIGTLVKPVLEVPQWPNCYIYSLSDLNRATNIQKEFYNHYKTKFLEGHYLDLKGNLNYIFVLFYDLIEAYTQKHHDMNLLTSQFKKLEELCPKIRRYADIFLKSRLLNVEEKQSKISMNDLQTITDPVKESYQSWDWKNVYIKKLNLNKEDAKYLDDIWISSTTFLNIEQCCAEVLKLYIASIKNLKSIYAQLGTNTKEQFAVVNDLIARKQYRYHLNSPNYNYIITNGDHQLHMYILRYCENQLRILYNHKRRINLDSYYSHAEVKQSLEEKIIVHITAHMPALLEKTACPTQETEVELNMLNTTRWKNYIPLTEENYKSKGKDTFYNELTALLNFNAKNPSLESIYYELSKFLAAFDKLLALKLYLQYTYKNKLTKSQPLKLLPKTAYKQLFHDQSQRESFEAIIIALIESSDITKAIDQIDSFYLPARKKIQLNLAEIRQVENQHSETVSILNEYLKEEEEELLNSKTTVDIETSIPTNATCQTPIFSKTFNVLYKVTLSPTEIGMLELFKSNSFSLQVTFAEDFCKGQGAVKGTVINNINETCYDLLDDILIEEDESELTINPTYYNQIINE